ncbi:FecR family protein [Pseudomonas sp. X10]
MSPMPALQTPADPEKEALEWFSRLRNPACGEALLRAFEAWRQDPDNARAYAELEAYWEQLRPPPARPRPRPLKAVRSHTGKGLAAIFLLLLAGLLAFYWPVLQRLACELYTDAGERRSVRLPDGSTLHLDSASAVNIDLRGRTRTLQLVQGQVYLEVMLDGRPFEVQVDDARIQVYGTRLMLARSAGRNELVVLSGKSGVNSAGNERLLSAGERITFNDLRMDSVEKTDTTARTAWRSGHLQARDMPLSQVIEQLAGYQGKRAWLLDEQASHRRVSGDFNLDNAAISLETLAREQNLKVNDVLGQALIVR